MAVAPKELGKLCIFLVAIVIFFAIANAWYNPDAKNAKEKPFLAFVEKVRRICTNQGACVHDIKVRSGGWVTTFVAHTALELQRGDNVILLKVYKDTLVFPSRRGRARQDRDFHYEIVGKAPP